MAKATALLMVLLVATLSLSGCLRNGKGGEGEAGPEYEPGPYGVLTYEDLVYASGLAHTATSSEAEPVSLKLDVYCPDTNSTCLLYTSPSPRDISGSRMPSSA